MVSLKREESITSRPACRLKRYLIFGVWIISSGLSGFESVLYDSWPPLSLMLGL